MAQKILLRRGPIGNLSGASTQKGELLLVTGSLGNLTGPFITMTGTSGTNASTVVGKIYTGAAAPTLTVNHSALNGTPFYSTTDQVLYILDHAGNVNPDLTGNIEDNHIANVTIDQLSGSVSIVANGTTDGDLTVAASGSFGGDVTVTGDITGSNMYLTGDALIDGNITLGGNIQIGDNQVDTITFGGDVTSNILPDASGTYDLGSGAKIWNNIYVTAVNAETGNFTGNVAIDGTLDVDGATTLNSTLAVTGSTSLKSTLGVVGATSLDSTLSVTGSTTLKNTLGVDGATSLNSTLSVTGSTLLKSTLEAVGSTSLNSTLSVTGSTLLKSTLEAVGATSLNSTLSVTGSTVLKSTLNTQGNADFDADVNIDGAASLNSTLDVDAATTLNSTLAVTGSTTLKSTLNVQDDADFDANVNIDGTLDVTGATDLGSSLTVAGTTDLNGDVTISGDITLDGAGAQAITNSAGDLTISSTAGNVYVEGTQFTGNDVVIPGNLTVQGTQTIIDSTTVQIGDNIIELNAAGTAADGGIQVKDVVGLGTATGSFLWNATDDYWYAGVSGSTHYRVATFTNATPATDAVPRVDSNKRLVLGSITDNGSLVTISSLTKLTNAGGSDALSNSSAVVFRNSSNEVGYVSTTATTNVLTGILGYSEATGKLEFSNVIDGGTF